jgi:hypothetical protein
MNAFTDRVNAKLPTEQPDSILLALVQRLGTPDSSHKSVSRGHLSLPSET